MKGPRGWRPPSAGQNSAAIRSCDGGVAAPRAATALALECGDQVVAVLALYRVAQNAFSGEELRVLHAIRGKLGAAVERAFRQERAEQLSAVDPVTGLPNRRAMFLRLDSDLARCRRNRGTLAVLVCEIDGIGTVGKRSTAAAGRLCQAIAAGLRQLCREDDFVARMGESFVLALSGFSPQHLPDKLRLIQSLLSNLESCSPLALRLGAAYYPEDGVDAEDLLATADARLTPQDSALTREMAR